MFLDLVKLSVPIRSTYVFHKQQKRLYFYWAYNIHYTFQAPIQRFADQIAGVFVPTIVLLATATLIVWILIGQTKLEWIKNHNQVIHIYCN